MIVHRPARQLSRARAMRSEPTKAEKMLWRSLRSGALGLRFRRQATVGPCIVDFACLPAKLIIELDGPPHETAEQQEWDRAGDAWFLARGWRVLRFPNELMFGGTDIVIDRIKRLLPDGPSSDPASRGHLLPQAGEGGREDTCR